MNRDWKHKNGDGPEYTNNADVVRDYNQGASHSYYTRKNILTRTAHVSLIKTLYLYIIHNDAIQQVYNTQKWVLGNQW